MSVAVAILAHRPSNRLVELVRALSGEGVRPILVVDDGSGAECHEVFAGAAAIAGVEVLRHAMPRGSGAALQTAVNQALCIRGEWAGLVFADSADVSVEDILQARAALAEGREWRTNGSVRAIPGSLLPRILQVRIADAAIEKLLGSVSAAVARPRSLRLTPVPVILGFAIAALVGVEIHGFRATTLFTQEIWYPIGLKRFTRYIAEFLAFAVPLLTMFQWSFAGVVAALLVVLTAVSVGPIPLLATGLFLISSCTLGRLLLGPGKTDSATLDVCATLLGSGVYVFMMTLLVRAPVNYPFVWVAVLAGPIFADWSGVVDRVEGWVSRIASVELQSPGERIAFGLLAFLLGAHWFVAMMPEVSADGLAMHLAIPMNIAANHRMTYEPARYLWSVMPMGTDWLYSIVYLLGGEYAAHILDYAMLLAIVALLYRAVRRWVSPAVGFLLAASLVASPIVQFVTGSLFVENYLVALVLALMTAIWHFGETGERRFLYLAMAAGGAAMATKYGALVFLVLALPFAAIEISRHRKALGSKPVAACAVALLLLLATALPTYVIAYEKTGNPIFPFLNRKIHSPLLDPSVPIVDARFRMPVDWSTLYNLTFHTSRAYEGQDGSFGFQYLLVIPLAVVGLLVAKRRVAVSAGIVGIVAGVAILESTPNVRYLYTSMPLLLIAFAALLGWASAKGRWLYRGLIGYIFITTLLNAYFLPSSSYYHKDFCLRLPFSRAEHDRYRDEAVPVRKVVAYYNQNHPGSPILLTSSTSIAGLTGEVYENNWHQQTIMEQLREASTPVAMLHLMERWKVGYFLTEPLPPYDTTVPRALTALLNACAAPEYATGGYSLLRLQADCNPPARVPGAPGIDPATQATVTPGTYDELDPAVAFGGEWTHDKSFEGPYRHSISYSDTPGAEASIAFQGSALMYVFTKAPNRGMATVSIDGGAPRTVDLYSADAQWQTHETFCCLGPGRHRAVVQVSGQANPKSTGRFVDVDSFVVQ